MDKEFKEFLLKESASFFGRSSRVLVSSLGKYRPKTFTEYKGQERAKSRLIRYVEEIKERKLLFPHTLIFGETGSGKTTLAEIIANELNLNFCPIIGSSLHNEEDIISKIVETNGGILFIDEIHSLERDLAEKFYPIMEDFKFEGNNILPFTLIGATTELGEIIKDRKPLYDRFGIHLELDTYKLDELITIAKQYKDRIFPKDNIKEEIYEVVAKNCRNNPRTLIRILEATIYFKGDIVDVLKMFGIIDSGFTEKDLKILKYISLNDTGVGLQGIATYLDTSTANYLYYIEPFLLKNGLIVKTGRGRKITEKGIKSIESMEHILVN